MRAASSGARSYGSMCPAAGNSTNSAPGSSAAISFACVERAQPVALTRQHDHPRAAQRLHRVQPLVLVQRRPEARHARRVAAAQLCGGERDVVPARSSTERHEPDAGPQHRRAPQQLTPAHPREPAGEPAFDAQHGRGQPARQAEGRLGQPARRAGEQQRPTRPLDEPGVPLRERHDRHRAHGVPDEHQLTGRRPIRDQLGEVVGEPVDRRRPVGCGVRAAVPAVGRSAAPGCPRPAGAARRPRSCRPPSSRAAARR